MGYWLALGLICISGIMGGVVYGISSLLDSGKTEKKDAFGNLVHTYDLLKGVSLEAFMLGRATVGAGGAIALVLVLIATKHYDNQYETGNLLFLTAACFVAGFIGHRVLPEVASQLEKQIAKTASDVATTKAKEVVEKRVTEVQKEERKDNREYGNVMLGIGLALQVLREHDPDHKAVQRRIEELEAWRKQAKYSTDRMLNMVLGRLYAEGLKDRDRAIQVLQEFTAKKLEKGPAGKDVDYADAMFNIACYYTKNMDAAAGEQRSELRKKALDTLQVAVEVSPSNGADAENESDFRSLWSDPEFKAIVESGKNHVKPSPTNGS